MSYISERLREIVQQSGRSQASFAEMMGISLSSQKNYEKGLRKPDVEYLTRLHEAGFDTHYLLTGERIGVAPEGFVHVPRLAAVGSMGSGIDGALAHDEVVEQITLSIVWLRAHLPALTSFRNLHLITGHGDSMSGTYEDGTPLFVDSGVKELLADGIYIFDLDGEIYIKRLQKMPKGRIMAISDNRNYEPFYIEKDDQFRVIGRIVGDLKFNKY